MGPHQDSQTQKQTNSHTSKPLIDIYIYYEPFLKPVHETNLYTNIIRMYTQTPDEFLKS